ncbi:MAG: hypothetical protein B7Z62_07320 [Deltaproteobacteria bacterium 37-65-8]|nr:MAG: hypothetical protein B7Z62_07320 [Deltaproteobacteria bacterium 37-65-8]
MGKKGAFHLLFAVGRQGGAVLTFQGGLNDLEATIPPDRRSLTRFVDVIIFLHRYYMQIGACP